MQLHVLAAWQAQTHGCLAHGKVMRMFGCSLSAHVQVSFVNSICTLKGGTHVKLIVDQICKCAAAVPVHPRG